MNVIIVAAGTGSRLGKVCQNTPKALLQFGGVTAIERFLTKVPLTPSDMLCVVVGQDYKGELLRGFVSQKYGAQAGFAVQPEPIGTCDAVWRAVEALGGKLAPALIAWSDIMPGEELTPLPDQSVVFTTADFPCRYNFWNGRLEEVVHGNVIGMYFVHDSPEDWLSKVRAKPRADFVEMMPELKPVEKQIRCLDFGTEKTYLKTRDQFSTSAYARVERRGPNAVKVYSDLDNELFESEVAWYRHLPPTAKRFVPQVFQSGNRELLMRYVEGNAVDFESPDDMRDFLARVVYVLDEFFHSCKFPTTLGSLYKEYVEKPLQRSEVVRAIVPGLSTDYDLMINGQEYVNPRVLLAQAQYSTRLVTYLNPPVFGFLHGDPTLQNMKVRDVGTVVLFDPKGKFGDTAMYGDPKYDFAKLYYSFVGNWDGFNRGEYSFDAELDPVSKAVKFTYDIGKARFASLGDWYLEYLQRHLGIQPTQIKLLHALIWLRVSGYVFPQSIEQATVAFLHGTVLFNKAIEEAGLC